MKQNQRQSGAVSLFVVIFTALLITVIVVSFVRLMIRDQQQATANDLSQSAYDSAQAGVEDAKRALLRYKFECSSAGNALKCTELETLLFDANPPCDTIFKAIGVGATDAETIVQQSGTDSTLDQAYTCVKIQLNTNDYLGQLAAEESKLIRLTGVSAFDTVRLSWFSYQDFSSDTSDRSIDLEPGAGYPLPVVADWAYNRPSVVRAQLIQTSDSGFTLTDFDGVTNTNNARSLTLYPAAVGLNNEAFITGDNSRSPLLSMARVKCRAEINSGGYACAVDLQLPDPIDGDANTRNAFLRLAAHYNPSHYKLELYNGANLVQLKGVQPSVDSTGRANDYFRRVESRIEMQDTSFPYPEAAVDLEGSLCKDFRITDNPIDYSSVCTP